MDQLLSIDEYDILVLELALNDQSYVRTKTVEFYPDHGRPFEELIRRALHKNPNLVIIPVVFSPLRHLLILEYPPICPELEIDSAYLKLAEHYDLTVIRFIHILCNDKFNITGISKSQQLQLSQKFLSPLDHMHSGPLVHQILSEFMLFYFKKSLSELLTTAENHKKHLFFQPPKVNSVVPFYTTTREDFDSECLVAHKNSNIADPRQTRLSTGLKDFSKKGFLLTTNYTLDYLKIAAMAGEHSYGEFLFTGNFKRGIEICNGKGYKIKLSISHVLCNCTTTELKVTTFFQFENEAKVMPVDYHLPLITTGFKTNYIQYLIPARGDIVSGLSMCTRPWNTISSIYMKLEQNDIYVDYFFRMVALIVEYECCS